MALEATSPRNCLEARSRFLSLGSVAITEFNACQDTWTEVKVMENRTMTMIK